MDASLLEYRLWLLLGAVVLPLWLLAGVCDYVVHARTRIAETSGVHESALHLLQTAEIGAPMLAVLLLEVNASVLLLAAAGVAAHSITAYRDLRYAAPRRRIPVIEQYAHAFLIVLPVVALALVAVLHWPELAAAPTGAGDWALRWKRPAWDAGVLAGVLAASVLLGVLPGLREFAVAWRAHRDARHGPVRDGAPRASGAPLRENAVSPGATRGRRALE